MWLEVAVGVAVILMMAGSVWGASAYGSRGAKLRQKTQEGRDARDQIKRLTRPLPSLRAALRRLSKSSKDD